MGSSDLLAHASAFKGSTELWSVDEQQRDGYQAEHCSA